MMDIDWKRKAMDVPVIGSRRPRSPGRPGFLCCLGFLRSWHCYRRRHSRDSRQVCLGQADSFGHDEQVLLNNVERSWSEKFGLANLSIKDV
jgi:hypothetical protein